MKSWAQLHFETYGLAFISAKQKIYPFDASDAINQFRVPVTLVMEQIHQEQMAEAARILKSFKDNRPKPNVKPYSLVKETYDPPSNSTKVSMIESNHYAWLRSA